MRRTGEWLRVGGVLGLIGTSALFGCESDGRATDVTEGARELGGVSLGLTLPDGSEVASVNYVVTRNGVYRKLSQGA